MKRLLILFLLAGAAGAQELPDAPIPKVPSVAPAEPDLTGGGKGAGDAFGGASPRTFDKKFFAMYGILGAAKAADLVTTARWDCRTCYERNPIFGRHPSSARLVGVGSAYYVGEIFLGYELKRFGERHRWARYAWCIEPSFQIGDHIYWARQNATRRR